MRKLLVALAFVAVPTVALAQSGSHYDWQSGNSYNWNGSPGGNTRVYGNNLNTGSSWNTTINPNGNMNGFDSSGNSWNYNAQSKTYFNSNGTMCSGSGAARTCY